MRKPNILGPVQSFEYEACDLSCAANAQRPASFLGFAPIKRFEREQDPADLAPKGRFIAAEAIKREIRQIG